MFPSVLTFNAVDVTAETLTYSPEIIVHLVAFGTGNPAIDGEAWTFSRSFDDDDDDGVCTVREIQRATVYEGIQSFSLRRSRLDCVFIPKMAAKVGYSELRITFRIDDQEWANLVAVARIVFRHKAYFTSSE